MKLPIEYLIMTLVVTFILMMVLPVHAQLVPAIDMSAIAQIESSGNPSAVNSSSGCIGLYQINPKGALADWNQNHSIKYSREDLFNAEINELIARWYLSEKFPAYLRHFNQPVDVDHILWAYNAGIGMVVKGILPDETRRYIQKYKNLTKDEIAKEYKHSKLYGMLCSPTEKKQWTFQNIAIQIYFSKLYRLLRPQIAVNYRHCIKQITVQ